MRTQNQKLKLLYLMQILKQYTDEAHPMTVQGMLDKLAAQGIAAERKAIYRDLEALGDFGLDVVKVQKKGFFVGARSFSTVELKLLADAVASSKFITGKKSSALLNKLAGLTSVHHANALKRQVYYLDRIKSENEQIYYNTDALHLAIEEKRQIAFKYYSYDMDKKLKPKRNGEKYVVSPYMLLWEDENYYLIAYHPRYQSLAHFRVDKMSDIVPLENKVQKIDLNPAEYAKKTFSMFGGQEQAVELAFNPRLIGVFIDRFGKNVSITKQGEQLKTRVKVRISPSFYAWVFALKNDVTIVKPKGVVTEYVTYLQKTLDNYK